MFFANAKFAKFVALSKFFTRVDFKDLCRFPFNNHIEI